MTKYAKGSRAWGECDRSGKRMLLKDMVADGYYPDLIVDPAWRDERHPQEHLKPLHDPETLYRPAPMDLPSLDPPVLTFSISGVSPNAGVILSWTEVTTKASQIKEYQVFRERQILPQNSVPSDYTRIATLPVVRDAFGAITSNPLTYTDPDGSVDLDVYFYVYFVIGIPEQGPSAKSNLRGVTFPPVAVVLSGSWNSSLNRFELSWTTSPEASVGGYHLYRSVDNGAYTFVAHIDVPTTTYNDTSIDRLNHRYAYKVAPHDHVLDIQGPDSNILTFAKLVGPDRLVIDLDVLSFGGTVVWNYTTATSTFDMQTFPLQFNLGTLPLVPVYPLPASGKYYWEAKCIGISPRFNSGFNAGYGFCVQAHRYPSDDAAAGNNFVAFLDNYEGGTAAAIQIGSGATQVALPGDAFVVNDVAMIAVDFALKKVWFGKNGTWKGGGTQDPATGQGGFWPTDETSVSPAGATSRNWYGPWMSGDFSTTGENTEWRFAASKWGFSPPSGFGQWIVWSPGVTPDTTLPFVDPNGTFRLKNFIPGLCMWKPTTVNSHQIRSQTQRGVGSGKRYFEVSQIANVLSSGAGVQFWNIGITRTGSANNIDLHSTGVAVDATGKVQDFNNSFGTYGAVSYNNTVDGRATDDAAGGDTVMVAVDFTAQRAYFGMNGVWFNGQDPTSGVGGIPLPTLGVTDWVAACSSFSTACRALFNTGGLAFIHAAPTGYQGWDE